jgi:choline monooxygenase
MTFSYNLDHLFAQESIIKNGLPAATYIDEQFRAIENNTIFTSTWVFAGFAHELSKTGDVCPVSVAGKPFFLVRNNDNEITAFHNVCRHRCLKLVDENGNSGQLIRCPYHSWVYDLQGSLKAAPYFGGKDRSPPEDFVLQDNGLVPVNCATWYDWVFINIDGNAGLIEDFVAPLERQLEGLDLNRIKPVATIDFGIVKTNWKALMENFIEPYHVQFVHKNTTSQPLVDHYTVLDDHCLGSACDIEENPDIDKSSTLAVTSRFLTLFPNFVMGTYAPDQIGIHLNTPVSPGETRQKRVIYVHQDSKISDAEIENISNLWHEVHKEDHDICERLQEGRMSDVAANGGLLSPHWEDSVRRFQELVAQSVSPDLSRVIQN